MKNLNAIPISEKLNKLAGIFPADLFIVGGKVRNHLMKIENDDIDLCSTASLLEIEKVFEGTEFELKFRNEELQTAKIIVGDSIFDYARFRTEVYEKGGKRFPKSVEFVGSPEKDYLRRDFSVNAIYYNIKNEDFLDYCDGIKDLRNRLIKCVRNPYEVLKDDGIRILRMIRIACELNFRIERNTLLAASENISNLLNISGVKLANEFKRICDSSFYGFGTKNAHMRGFKLLNKLNAWKYLGVSFDKLKLKMVKKQTKKYFGLLIDIIDSERPASISYFLNNILDKLELNKKKKEEIINIISGYYDALNRMSNKVYFAKYFDNFPKIYEILSQKSKVIAQKYNFFYKYIINHKLVVKVSDLKVSARDLSKYFPSLPKKSYNIILNMVLSDVFEGKYTNDNETILKEIDKKLKIY